MEGVVSWESGGACGVVGLEFGTEMVKGGDSHPACSGCATLSFGCVCACGLMRRGLFWEVECEDGNWDGICGCS
jgi:hypothetical protein